MLDNRIIKKSEELNPDQNLSENNFPSDLPRLLYLAEKENNTEAQLELAKMYEFGNGCDKDFREAKYWYQVAANNGNAEAQFRVGKIHEYGEDVLQDDDEAIIWYTKAAEQGHKEAQFTLEFLKNFDNFEWVKKTAEETKHPDLLFRLAQMYEDKNEEEKAIEYYKKASKQGDSEASITVAEKYEQKAIKAPKNSKQYLGEALLWYEIAVKQGNNSASLELISAQRHLADLYYNKGRGTTQDFGKALELYEKIATHVQEIDDIQKIFLRIAYMYHTGKGCQKDISKAIKWYVKAVEEWSDEAAEQLIELANNENVDAQYEVGKIYLNDYYVSPVRCFDEFNRYAEAIKWLSKADNNGHQGAKNILAEAQFKLGVLLFEKTKNSFAEALNLLQLAQSNGNDDAINFLLTHQDDFNFLK